MEGNIVTLRQSWVSLKKGIIQVAIYQSNRLDKMKRTWFSPPPLGSVRISGIACVKWKIDLGNLGYHSLTSNIILKNFPYVFSSTSFLSSTNHNILYY